MRVDPTRADPDTNRDRSRKERRDTMLPAEVRWHWIVLVGAGLIVVLGYFLDVEPEGSVGLAGLPSIKFPVLCPSRRFFGVTCPGCGMTRSVTHLLHGRLGDSFGTHRLGWLVFAAIVFQFPYRVWRLLGRSSSLQKPHFAQILLWGFLILLIVNWMLPA